LSNEKLNRSDQLNSESDLLAVRSTSAGLMAQLFPVLFGIVATLLLRQLIASIFEPRSFVYTLFMPEGGIFGQIVPLAIMLLFFWTIADLVIKLFGISRQARALSDPAVKGSPHKVGTSNIEEAIHELQRVSEPKQTGYVIQTLVTLMRHLRSANDTQRSHEFFRHQTDLDSEAIASSYTAVRVFIWAMPILGFIGTVIGISLAVGDFSGFLSGDIDDIEVVKQELANVSTGLSFAFNTTLLGLVASLIAMLLTTYVQRRDELLSRGVEELCLRIIAHTPEIQARGAPNVDSGMLIDSMEAFAGAVAQESERLRGGFDGFNSRFSEVGNKIVDSYSGLGVSLEEQTANSARQMNDLSSQLTNALSDASSAFYETSSALSKELESFAPDLGVMRKAIVDGLDRVDRYNAQFEEVLRANTQEVVASQEKLSEKIAAGLDRVDQSNGQFEEVLRANAQQVVASQERLGDKIAAGLDRVDQSSGLFEGVLRANTQHVVESQEKLSVKIAEGLERVGQANSQFEEVLRSNAQEVVASQGKLGEKIAEGLDRVDRSNGQFEDVLRSNTQQVVTSQEMIANVTQSIDKSSGALQQVKEVHATLLPVLEELKGPMEFKMVPASKNTKDDKG
jgi:biopolymer transport protein ExbB/TolQ